MKYYIRFKLNFFKGAPKLEAPAKNNSNSNTDKVVYFQTCVNRVFGQYKDSKQLPLSKSILNLLEKAKYDVIIPNNVNNLCCGMAFDSKGFTGVSQDKNTELIKILREASDNGKYPILIDASPCCLHLKGRSLNVN